MYKASFETEQNYPIIDFCEEKKNQYKNSVYYKKNF